jgi:hypothetical protein
VRSISSSSGSGSSSSSLIKFTEKHDKNHETDNKTHPYTPNIFPYALKCSSGGGGSSSGSGS